MDLRAKIGGQVTHGRFIGLATAAILFFFSITQAHAEEGAVPNEFLVKLKPGARFMFDSLAKSAGIQESRAVSPDIMVVKTNSLIRHQHAFDALSKNSQFEVVEPNYIYHRMKTPNDPDLGELWGLVNQGKLGGRAGVDIGAAQAWDLATGSDKVVVAVIDTGVDYTHPDLHSNMWVNAAEANGISGVDDDNNGFVDDIYGYDFVNNDGDPMDDHGHGTHCSGTIGARGDDGVGIVGVVWNTKIMGLKFLNEDGSGTLENAIKSINYATASGVDIMSNSWGGGPYSQLLEEAIRNSQKKGILFVAAAGNSASNNDTTPSYPASYDIDNVISVAAIDRAGKLASFSNYGEQSVDIAAPGVAIYSTIPGGHDSFNGTSMATPHVSGVAALLKSYQRNLTYDLIKSRLLASSRPLGSLRGKVATMGVVNAFYALSNQVAPIDEEDPYNWLHMPQAHSSAHPYPSDTKQTYVVTVPGVRKISAYFEKFETEKTYDTVTFKDAEGKVIGKWSGLHDNEYSPVANGDTLYIEFSSDNSVQKHGFDITKVAYQ